MVQEKTVRSNHTLSIVDDPLFSFMLYQP